MKTKTFDYSKWLSNRAAKESTKTVNFSELTKVEKLNTLFNLLDKCEDDFKEVTILSTEERQFKDLSTPARLFVLNERNKEAQNALVAGDMDKVIELLKEPKPDFICKVSVKTSFKNASMNSQIEYLTKLCEKQNISLETITVNLPCGQQWVKGLENFIIQKELINLAYNSEKDLDKAISIAKEIAAEMKKAETTKQPI
jgi:hypothetical protein